MNKNATVIDRGADEILVIDGEVISIEKLKGKKLIDLLNRHHLTDIQIVSYDEYELSGELL